MTTVTVPREYLEHPLHGEPQIISARELLGLKLPLGEYLLEPVIPVGGILLIHGESGIGKTWFCLNLATALATGSPFLIWNTPAPRRVLYIDGETAIQDLQGRLLECIKMVPVDSVDAVWENLGFISAMHIDHDLPSLADADGQRWYTEAVKGYDLVILDNLSTLAYGDRSENEMESWLPIQQWALSRRRENQSLIFVHHSGKSGDQEAPAPVRSLWIGS